MVVGRIVEQAVADMVVFEVRVTVVARTAVDIELDVAVAGTVVALVFPSIWLYSREQLVGLLLYCLLKYI